MSSFIRSCLLPVVLSLAFLLLLNSTTYSAPREELLIAKGMQKMSEGKMKEALKLFDQALEVSPGNIEARYYSGMAHSRLGELKKAEDIFSGILQKNDKFNDAHLELGRLYYIQTECDKADNSLNKFVSISDDSDLNKYASEMMKACRDDEAADRGGRPSGYYVNLSLGGQHDDNVIVEPTNTLNPSDRKSDFRALFYLTAGADIFERDFFKLKGVYTFYLSQHQHMTEFNVNYHELSPTIELDVSSMFKPSAGYSMGYTSIGGDLYSLNHKYFAKVKVVEDDRSSTDIMYEYSTTKYWDSDLFQTTSIRTGHKNSTGIRQNYSDNFNADIYFFYDAERAKVDYWGYDGFRVGGNISIEIVTSLYGGLSAEYSEREYEGISPSAAEIRLDRMQQYSCRLTYVVNDTFSLQLTEAYTINDSNLDLFNYRRNIVGIFLTAGVS